MVCTIVVVVSVVLDSPTFLIGSFGMRLFLFEANTSDSGVKNIAINLVNNM